MVERSIHTAAANGNIDLVRALLDEDPGLVDLDDEYKWRPIFHAGLYKHLDVVQLLIDRGADLSAHDGYALHYAAEVPGNMPIVTLLIQYGALDAHAEPDSQAARQLIHAVYLENISRVTSLIAAAPELVREHYARGETAFHHACRNGNLEVVRALVAGGADVNAPSESGQFPLYCAAGHGHLEIVLYLLSQGADLAQRLQDGKTVTAWLQQYPQDRRFRPILEALANYKSDGPP